MRVVIKSFHKEISNLKKLIPQQYFMLWFKCSTPVSSVLCVCRQVASVTG